MATEENKKFDSEGPVPLLLVPRSEMSQAINAQIAMGQMLQRHPWDKTWREWDKKNLDLLTAGFSTIQVADEYESASPTGYPAFDIFGLAASAMGLRHDGIRLEAKIRALEGIRSRLALYEALARARTGPTGSSIFVVHGHDGDTKYQVAEFLERVTGTRPVIFHEQIDAGRTILEKFEALASGAGFAVVLLTADDEGRARGVEGLNLRARQNVVLELGFFIGMLGRSRVVALYGEGVELPSDLSGLLYKPLTGNWHTDLVKELTAAGIEVDMRRLTR